MPNYNKLVRDHIPEIIEKQGKQCSTKILDYEEYIKELKKKGFEELEEYINAESNKAALEELADVLEIIHALAKYHGASIEQVEEIRMQKETERGSFNRRIFLIEAD